MVGRRSDGLAEFAKLGAEVAVGDMRDARFLQEAFAGASGAYTLLPYNYQAVDLGQDQDGIIEAVVTAARAVRLPKLVALSSFGAHLERDAGVVDGLRRFEERVAALAYANAQ